MSRSLIVDAISIKLLPVVGTSVQTRLEPSNRVSSAVVDGCRSLDVLGDLTHRLGPCFITSVVHQFA